MVDRLDGNWGPEPGGGQESLGPWLPTEKPQQPERFWPLRMTETTRSVVVSALEEAAQRKREAVETCGDCRDGRCQSCAWRTHMAAEYERVAEVVAEAQPHDGRAAVGRARLALGETATVIAETEVGP